MGDRDEAADALQDAFISAFRRADSFRGDAKVTTWLHRIVVNACLDRIRCRQVRAADPLPEGEDRAAEMAGPAQDDPAEVRERQVDVLNALKQLNPDQRTRWCWSTWRATRSKRPRGSWAARRVR